MTIPDLESAGLEAAANSFIQKFHALPAGSDSYLTRIKEAMEPAIRTYLSAARSAPEAGKAVGADLIERLKKWSDPTETERIMTHWDSWRKYIKEGGGGSWPRDAFESILDAINQDATEAVAALTASEAEATALRRKLEEHRKALEECERILCQTPQDRRTKAHRCAIGAARKALEQGGASE